MITLLLSLLTSSAMANTTYVERLQIQTQSLSPYERCIEMCGEMSDVRDQHYQQCVAGCATWDNEKTTTK